MNKRQMIFGLVTSAAIALLGGLTLAYGGPIGVQMVLIGIVGLLIFGYKALGDVKSG
ncbi:hypothetical protein IAG25_32660 [Caballeronia sp. EK]|uniref:hypothetical protein n=1 Tax=Caballeronia sp. EK TaxID=2767469 RepID=UPI001654C9F2|nr:hypothetical protein [Caballeronia sp. EK]MBC8641577.1 hypothetical protein [Caballeronia sp. EK]